MPEAQQEFQKRQIAYKVKISGVQGAVFSKDDASAGYIKINGANISRINLIATIVDKFVQGYASAVIDDSSGRISLKSFENINVFDKVELGDVVLVVGKIREYNKDKYILPEIVRKTDPDWIRVRMAELGDEIVIAQKHESNVEEAKANATPSEQIYLLIKDLDKGDGASVDEIISKSRNADAEIVINKLMEDGDVFEIKPGRIKVLE